MRNSDDRRLRRIQGGAVGAAVSRTRVPLKARSGRWAPQLVLAKRLAFLGFDFRFGFVKGQQPLNSLWGEWSPEVGRGESKHPSLPLARAERKPFDHKRKPAPRHQREIPLKGNSALLQQQADRPRARKNKKQKPPHRGPGTGVLFVSQTAIKRSCSHALPYG